MTHVRGARSSLATAMVAALLMLAPTTGWTAPITIVRDTINMFRDDRGVNNVGQNVGSRVQYGADVQGGSGGTTVGAFHTIPPSTIDFTHPQSACQPITVNPNQCASSFPFNATRLDNWMIRFTNGLDSLTVPAPSIVGAENPVPFPVSVTITSGATPTTPTISWVIPGTFTPDAFRVTIFDVEGPTLPNGVKNVIFSRAIAPGSTSFTIPVSANLKADHTYSVSFQVIDLRSGFTEAQFLQSNNNAMILRRSTSFFNFQAQGGDVPNIHLPQVGPDPNPSDDVGAPYIFSIEVVGPNSVTFIDPVVAIGYDYAIGTGNPNFASVLLPDIGDGIYDVIFAGLHHVVAAGQQFFFPSGGVSAFSVRDIEASAGLDPLNTTAFITGLTFVSEGSFTGTMTSITTFVPDAAVPGPASLLVTAVGAILLVGVARLQEFRRSRLRG